MNHESKDSHLGRSALVQFNSTLLHLLLLAGVPVEHAVSQVTGKFSLTLVRHDKDLQEANEGEDLEDSGLGDVREPGNSSLDRGKRKVRGEVSGKAGTEGRVDVSENGKHGNTSVLDFDVTETVESVLISTIQNVQGVPIDKKSEKESAIVFKVAAISCSDQPKSTTIRGTSSTSVLDFDVPESQGLLGTESIVKGSSQRGGSPRCLLGSKGGGGAGKESESSNSLHGLFITTKILFDAFFERGACLRVIQRYGVTDDDLKLRFSLFSPGFAFKFPDPGLSALPHFPSRGYRLKSET